MNFSERVTLLFNAAAPERAGEIARLWNKYSPQFESDPDTRDFQVYAQGGEVRCTQRSLWEVWILGFASWSALRAYGGLFFESRFAGRPVDLIALDTDAQANVHQQRFNECLTAARRLEATPDFEDFAWPDSIPPPGDREAGDNTYKVIFDLVSLAIAYIFLHEVAHLRFARDRKRPARKPLEELMCDQWARDWLVDKLKKYARKYQQPPVLVRQKRIMGQIVALLVVMCTTTPAGWKGTTTHPPVADRLRKLARASKQPADDTSWIFFASVLIAWLRADGRLPDLTLEGPIKESVITLLDAL